MERRRQDMVEEAIRQRWGFRRSLASDSMGNSGEQMTTQNLS